MTPIEVPGSTHARAIVFYATNDTYAVSALVAAAKLRRLGALAAADVVLLHLPLGRHVVRALHAAGVLTCAVERLPRAHGRYFRDCLVKFHVFRLTGYERIVFLDADALPLADPSGLFTVPSRRHPIAAPRAYWLSGRGERVSSALMAIAPDLSLWERACRHFATARARRVYDMNILNDEFGDEIQLLPDGRLCLDSSWEDTGNLAHLRDMEERHGPCLVVHFSALGKPWSRTLAQVRRLRPHADARFFEFRQEWWRLRAEVTRTARALDRWRFTWLAAAGRRRARV